MSVDWEFCIVHEESPNFSVEEMLKMLAHLESAGYLQNIAFEGFRGDDSVALADLDAVANWLQTDGGSWDTVHCDYSISVLGDPVESQTLYPVFSNLCDELMDASGLASDEGVVSPVYSMSVSPGGVDVHMEGYINDEIFMAILGKKPTVTALVQGLSAAVNRPMHMVVMESISWMREVPVEEVLSRIKADIESGMAGASEEFKALVGDKLIEPVQRSFNSNSEYPRENYWVVTEEFEHNKHMCFAAYDPSATCWYMARPLQDEEADYLGFYPSVFSSFVYMIEQEMDRRTGD
ncbi:MAG: hypothetical protein ABJ308_15280 [Halieaceae bacterium]